ncbi:MAG TPA: MurR/RpiR family transcriptional regulator [Shinella sp.]|jgi:DNA-binding MurR/RpiR family transcriptional regulator|uniref:MurR/RpiR family transcriptional regulator n=1 Tax=Shinella sp. TaxID=1870904 RepID=UPI0029B73F2E|nr:MurR/RpiR family transcriptional regulator [Shinella sp.]MDX3974484.1 MurR/RpiR family transcriptional regulator [Shinella sp.]HEV7249715.1 MurR/RpiR family transcriptional regulator [Shinella sp.]
MPRVKQSDQPPPKTANYEAFFNIVTEAYPGLSDRFQQVARFITQNPNVVAMQSINAIAEQCGAHPSILVRFAQNFGFSGFKQLQSVFQSRLSTAAPGYRERISALDVDLEKTKRKGNLGFLHDLVVRDIATLQELLNTTTEESLSQAARALKNANTIFIAGQLRSEPIAKFLRYVLSMLQCRVILLDPAGGLAPEMAKVMGKKDVLVAIAFRHYAKEVVTIADVAAENGTPIVAITDSQLSPLAKNATVLFTIPEDEYSFSRSLAAPMCLTQTIAVALAALLQEDKKGSPEIPTVTGKQQRRKH